MLSNRNKSSTWLKLTGVIAGVTFAILRVIAKEKKKDYTYENEPEQKNPMEGKMTIFVENDSDSENADGVCGHLEAVGESEYTFDLYDKYVKRAIDIILSFLGLVLLSPVFLGFAIAIKIDDPGPVFFTQKRLGRNKKYFKLHKFRSMKMSTPHDIPTHMLENPDQYITSVGRFMRRHSIDELPQIWDIFVGEMSVIGPRPGLWNQDVLIAERDKYGANSIKPGLTGWAQINGRDELEIADKAKFDGEYVKKKGLIMDMRCFLESVGVFGGDKSVVEGSTRAKAGCNFTNGKTDAELIGQIGFGETVEVDLNNNKKVLITGADSYIGKNFRKYAFEHYPSLEIDEIDMIDNTWRDMDFSSYDIIYHVAGIAHADTGNADKDTRSEYYAVNTELAVEVCTKAKNEGVKVFIFMSSMIVYGDSVPCGKSKIIDEHTVPATADFYGDSKLQADVAVRELANNRFKVIVLRPPMIYGRGSKGNYSILAKFARKLPVFPNIANERSMLYIDNLSEFLCQIMLVKTIKANSVVLLPQNTEWTKTSNMVKGIAKASGRKILLLGGVMKLAVLLGGKIPGKIGKMINKAFGNNCYAHRISLYDGIDYQIISLKESIKEAENKKFSYINESAEKKPKVLLVASVASMIDQFNMENIQLLLEHGYEVEVACNCKEGNTISDERVKDLIDRLAKKGVAVVHIPIPRKIFNIKGIILSISQLKVMINAKNYALVHCHSPIGSVVARISAAKARRNGTKIIYTAHGFHFYKGAPRRNWMILYPIEKELSKITDTLITINKEDYEFAKKHMHAKNTEYVPGVGIETKKFHLKKFNRVAKRAELGISDKDIMILSIGELNQNKNHEVIIRAIAKLKNENIHYFIVGKGIKDRYLKNLARELNVRLHLPGYRTDIVELLNAADIYALPSYREGLSVSLMEAMAAGLPCVVSNIRGNVDLIDHGKGGYLCEAGDVNCFAETIALLLENNDKCNKISEANLSKIQKFDNKKVMRKMENIYGLR